MSPSSAIWAFLAAAVFSSPVATAKDMRWDLPLAWPESNFHTRNAMTFAQEVEKVTKGSVKITIHANGSLGFKGPEMLTAVGQGLVPIADVHLGQQAGNAPILALDALPYIASDIDQLKILYKHWRPVVEDVAGKHNQKVLYFVPWPPALIYTKTEVKTVRDLRGMKIRTYSKASTDMMNSLGMSSIQMPWGELIPALASGAVDSVTTSAASGVDGKFWDHLKFMYQTSHTWTTNMLSVNIDAWRQLTKQQQAAIEGAAKRLEPDFLEVALKDHDAKMAILKRNGIRLGEVTEEMRTEMRSLTAPLVDQYIADVGPVAKKVIKAFRAEIAR